jgi:hypothetical protein
MRSVAVKYNQKGRADQQLPSSTSVDGKMLVEPGE